MLTFQLALIEQPRQVKLHLHCGDVLEWNLAGDVDNAVCSIMERKHTPLVLKLKGRKETTYLNTEDICRIVVENV